MKKTYRSIRSVFMSQMTSFNIPQVSILFTGIYLTVNPFQQKSIGIGVAASGGPDSMALVNLLNEWCVEEKRGPSFLGVICFHLCLYVEA